MDQTYFEDYCGYGSYDENYLFHSRVEHCIEIVDRFGIEVRSVLVLGAATGQVLHHFEDAWGLRPQGCEISRWAHRRIEPRKRRRIRCGDMRRYVPELARKRRRFDLIFSNALVYLQLPEIPGFLAVCSQIGRHFHFWSSTSEDHEPGDSYRVTLASKRWWSEAFRASGFSRTRSPYLWRSDLLARSQPGAGRASARGISSRQRRPVTDRGP
jgi:hypothetical protein